MRMKGPDCAVMCNIINTHTHTHTQAESRRNGERTNQEYVYDK